MKILYPEISPFHTFFLETGSPHLVYVEQAGNPEGIPVVFLHGGPCSGTKPDHRRFFDPERYRIILFDQRGCGQSLPFGTLENNNTLSLIEDMERIRHHLNIERWLIFGGSWGGALGLMYAQQHTETVLALIIRGVFLARQKDMDWFIREGGVARIYPEQWQRLMDCIPASFKHDPVQGLYEDLWGEDELARMRASLEWSAWGSQVALGASYQPESHTHATQKMLEQVRMEIHYARQQYFIDENQILNNCACLSDIPTVIIHGRNDLVCPIESGFMLHQALPRSDFMILPNAGHIAEGEAMINALVGATDRMAEILK